MIEPTPVGERRLKPASDTETLARRSSSGRPGQPDPGGTALVFETLLLRFTRTDAGLSMFGG